MPTVQEQLLNRKVTVVTKAGDDYSVDVHDQETKVRIQVTVQAGFNQVQLPDGFAYDEGESALLTVTQYEELSPTIFDAILSDDGPVDLTIGGLPYDLSQAALAGLTVTSTGGVVVLEPLGGAFPATVQMIATADYGGGSEEDVAGQAGIVWESDDEDVATVSPTGLVTAVGLGSAVITATYGGETDNLGIDVDVLESLELVITDAAMDIGAGADTTEQAAVTGTYTTAGATQTITPLTKLTWDSTDPLVASVSTAGLITALTVGTTDIMASLGAIDSNAPTVTVSDT